MTEEIILKLKKVEKRLQKLENSSRPCALMPFGETEQGETKTASECLLTSKSTQALILLAGADTKISVSTLSGTSSGKGIACLRLSKGVNNVSVSVTALSASDCTVILKIIDLE